MSKFSFIKDENKEEILTLEDIFKAYCSMDAISNAKNIELLPLSQINNWLKEAKILDMENVTTTDTGLCFIKFRKRAIDYHEFLQYLEDLVNVKKLDFKDVKYKLENCPKPLVTDKKKL